MISIAKNDLFIVSLGHIHAAILDDVEVEAYGEMQPITSLGQV